MKLKFFLKKESKYGNILIKHNITKRFFDIIFSLFILVFGCPIFLIIGLIVYLSSSGSIFYTHERIGRGNKKIKCFKFRTMKKNSDKTLKSLLEKNKNMKKEWDKYYKIKNDPRITYIGKFLRKSSLDELPQFFNVLKGDLSVVGPRPCVKKEIIQNFKENLHEILSIRPGITGIWQISGRNNLTRKKRVELEILYIKQQSLFLDLKIILRTLPLMISSKGAY
jgi:undecaprenyl-phosphate galactose phosphotransferase